jgi:hypothetical protein
MRLCPAFPVAMLLLLLLMLVHCCCCCCCCSADFPKTGGASLREMASEIGDNISESLGGKSGGPHSADPGVTTPEQEAAMRAVDNAKSK